MAQLGGENGAQMEGGEVAKFEPVKPEKWNFIVKTLETNIFMQKKSDFCKIISLRKEELMFSPDTNEPAKEVF